MELVISVFSDIMMWLSLPLFVAAGYIEHGWNLSSTGEGALALLTTALMFAWAYTWYRIGERQRLILYIKGMHEKAAVNPEKSDVQLRFLSANRQAHPDQNSEHSYASHD